MKTPVAAISLLLFLCTLRATCQVTPYRQGVTVLRDSCPSAADLAGRAVEPATAALLSNIAAGIANGTGLFQGFGPSCTCTLLIKQVGHYTSRNFVEVQIVTRLYYIAI